MTTITSRASGDAKKWAAQSDVLKLISALLSLVLTPTHNLIHTFDDTINDYRNKGKVKKAAKSQALFALG